MVLKEPLKNYDAWRERQLGRMARSERGTSPKVGL